MRNNKTNFLSNFHQGFTNTSPSMSLPKCPQETDDDVFMVSILTTHTNCMWNVWWVTDSGLASRSKRFEKQYGFEQ